VPYALITDSTTQTLSTLTPTVITLDTNNLLNGITHSIVTNTSRIGFPTAGIYLITISSSVSHTTGATVDIDIFLRKNGTIPGIANSSRRTSASTSNEITILAQSFLLSIAATDYIEIYQVASADDRAAGIYAIAATATEPAIPSITITIDYVSSIAP
jgi:hypothetical protein